MVAIRDLLAAVAPRSTRRWWLNSLAVLGAGFLGACWWLTEPLTDPASNPVRSATVVSAARPSTAGVAVAARALPTWPDRRLEGAEAKRLLLDVLRHAGDRLKEVEGYTAVLRKRERIRGELGPEQTLAIKVRHEPFAIYLKFLTPQSGKEAVYAEGLRDNKVIAHGGGLSRLLVPRLAVAPDHPLALVDSRHPVTEAGLANLTARLIQYRRMDLDDPKAATVLDRTTDPLGQPRYRSVHTHPARHVDRPFARVVVMYDPATLFPTSIESYDWPRASAQGPLELAESYTYDQIRLDAKLTALDFDPANPHYAFHRY